ncbi:MAG: AMP-binding protein, partial [Clostridia bacterium]|nr:AMP-binding protein [Clostridia bacterium]
MQKLTNTTPVLNPLFSFEDKESALGFNVPDVSMYGMLKISAESHPEAEAIDYFGNKISYKSLLERIVTASYSYNKLGVKKGDIVTIIMPNTPEALVSIYALNRLGAVCNIVHPLSAKEEIKLYVNSV